MSATSTSLPLLVTADDEILRIVREAKVVAVVGIKDESQPHAPAFTVPAAMKRRGIDIVPVNPTITSSLGVPALPDVAALAASRGAVDVLQVFRRPEAVGPLADEILAMPDGARPKVVWMQSGIVNDAAAEKLTRAGIRVVMDRCFAVEMARGVRA